MKKYLFLLLLLSTNAYAGDLEVIDGDTVRILNINQIDPKLLPLPPLRIDGIDTPETGKEAKCDLEIKKGMEAKEFVKLLIEDSNNIITFKLRTASKGINKGNYLTDKYGRLLGDVFVNKKSVADLLIKKGLAVSYSGGKKIKDWCK